MKRTIVFGDVHGCHDEWRDLLDKIGPTADDSLISVGDLISRGPSSAATLELAMSLPGLRCVLGNHELRFLGFWREHIEPEAGFFRATIAEMGDRHDDFMSWIDTWPLYIDDPDVTVIHAGLRPGVALADQSAADLTRLRTVEVESTDGRREVPWFELYTGSKLVVFGHWAARGLVVRDNVIGLDTGCVYGGKLSACILPERRIVDVPARRQYIDPFADARRT